VPPHSGRAPVCAQPPPEPTDGCAVVPELASAGSGASCCSSRTAAVEYRRATIISRRDRGAGSPCRRTSPRPHRQPDAVRRLLTPHSASCASCADRNVGARHPAIPTFRHRTYTAVASPRRLLAADQDADTELRCHGRLIAPRNGVDDASGVTLASNPPRLPPRDGLAPELSRTTPHARPYRISVDDGAGGDDEDDEDLDERMAPRYRRGRDARRAGACTGAGKPAMPCLGPLSTPRIGSKERLMPHAGSDHGKESMSPRRCRRVVPIPVVR